MPKKVDHEVSGPFLYQTKQQTGNEVRQVSLPNVKPTELHTFYSKNITLSKKKRWPIIWFAIVL